MIGEGRDDEALVAAVLAGDSVAFGSIYDRYADRIHDYAFSLLRQSSDAADVMQDTFLTASQRLDQLRDPSRLRPWLYSIARSFVYAASRSRQRVVVSDDVDEAVDGAAEMTSTDGALDARDLVWAAAAGLELGDRDVLDLHLRQDLDGQDLADALGVTSNAANVTLHRVRERLEQSVGAVLLARSSRGECAEFDRLVADGLSPLVRKRVARHLESCDVCSDRRAQATSASALFSMSGLVAAPVALRATVLGRVGTEDAVGAAGRLAWKADGFPVAPPSGFAAESTATGVTQRGAGTGWMTVVASAVALVVFFAALFMIVRRDAGPDLVGSQLPDSTVPTTIETVVNDVAAVTGVTDPTGPADSAAPTPTVASTVAQTAPETTSGAPSWTVLVTSTTVAPPIPPTVVVVDYQCARTMIVVVDITGAPPLRANLGFVDSDVQRQFEPDPAQPGRFSVNIVLTESSVIPQIVASSGAGTASAASTTQQLERCIIID